MTTQPILVHVLPDVGDERPALDELTQSLTAEIRQHDVESFGPLESADIPSDAKGLSIVAGWIAVQISFRNLARLVGSLADWAARNNRDVEISYGGDSIKVTKATSAQQERLINEWLERHSQP